MGVLYLGWSSTPEKNGSIDIGVLMLLTKVSLPAL